jgi:hypothetical protein
VRVMGAARVVSVAERSTDDELSMHDKLKPTHDCIDASCRFVHVRTHEISEG